MSPTIQEKIAAAKERARKAAEAVTKLEEQATRVPQRQKRTPKQVAELIRLDEEVRKVYGAGLGGLAEVVRKAKKDGLTVEEALALKTDTPREHHGDGDGALAVEDPSEGVVEVTLKPSAPQEPEWDTNDEPPSDQPPTPVPTVPESMPAADDAMPW